MVGKIHREWDFWQVWHNFVQFEALIGPLCSRALDSQKHESSDGLNET